MVAAPKVRDVWFEVFGLFFYQAFLLHAIILSCGINLGKFLLLHFAILFCWAWLGISYPLCWFNFCFVFGKTPFKCASLCFQHILIPQFFSWLVVWWPTDTETCWTPSALPPPVHPLLEPCELGSDLKTVKIDQSSLGKARLSLINQVPFSRLFRHSLWKKN